ncbi:T9SS type A sorting domain-containing protein [Saccharicrinis sp. FJH54]|uniref:T9SS type A sorting domain-containing protein n=1 Tax=Saccharicrinis sp. FJH54 TaxID=3344665 RepID=UPI0035D4B288
MKTPLLTLLLFLSFAPIICYSQTDAEILNRLFSGSEDITNQSKELISLSVDAVWYASEMTGYKTTFGTLTQSNANYDNWSYTETPNDKMVLNFANGDVIHFIFNAIDGFVDGDEYDFKRSHAMDFVSVIPDILNLRIQSETGPQDGKIYWTRTMTGSTTFDEISYSVNLTNTGNNNEEVENGFAFGDYVNETTGSVASSVLNYAINEKYYTSIGHNSNTGIYVQSRQIINSNSVTGSPGSYRFENVNCFWIGGTSFYNDACEGVYNQVIEDYNWLAQGTLYKNNVNYGTIKYDRPILNYSNGAYIIAACNDGKNFYLYPALQPNAITGISGLSSQINNKSYPNPATSKINISYTLVNGSNIRLTVMDQTGKVVEELNQEYQIPGKYNLSLSIENYPSGLYFYRIFTDEKTFWGKFTKIN